MISKERLNKLCLMGKMVWAVEYGVKIFKTSAKEAKQRMIEHTEEYHDLFETKEQAEWALKYHATRTEELNLPMWEDIKDIKGVKEHNIVNLVGLCFFLNFTFIQPQIVICASEELYNWNFNKENYITACNLCLKLFKGEAK